MVLPPFCRRVTPKADPTPINLTIHTISNELIHLDRY